MIKIAINGFGRIGRHSFKVAWTKKNLQIVAVNDIAESRVLAHLLKYDTAYPDFAPRVSHDEKHLIVGNKKIPVFAEKDPSFLPWKKLKVDVVLECTGKFTKKEGAELHLKAGAKKVVISAPSKGGAPTFVIGVNEKKYQGETIISNASCTTNCVAPVMKALEDVFGVRKALLTTIHSYTATQPLQDGPAKDLREARAAAQNMVPTTTGAAVATALTIPELAGKFDGLSVRVPTITVSLSDITVLLKKKVTKDEVNAAFTKASQGSMKGILGVTSEPLVSSDFIGDARSAIVDLSLTYVVDGDLVKVIAWYDNEWGYANRLVEMAEIVCGHTVIPNGAKRS
ncbi:MAG: type I glyceraldehyde-3-phosphate dehydrogenase [Patescibacteria group bacterium]